MVEEEESLRPNMCALAILSCRPNSHPFQERHISLHEPVKIGRSVARSRPTASNGIFDCKVLSRNHAVVWYEAEKFYIQDTKSSNGTFINNQRLCKSGEESPMREILSGDLIQLGVEVVENNRRGEKITHGCIIATITLYHPDGREAKPAPFLDAPNQPGIKIQTQDLYQLAQYLQEALHREKMLEQKLGSLQQLVLTTQQAAEGGWQALIDEDKLLSRLEMLENQLHIYSKNHAEDTLRQELVALQEDKIHYETTAKESLRRVLQEKLDAVTKLSDLERSLTSAEDECSHLKEMCESSQEELGQLATRYQDQLKEVQELQDKLQEAERSHEEEAERTEREKQELMDKLEDMMQQESTLSAKMESLQTENDFAREQLAAMKVKLESIKETNQADDKALDLGLEGILSEDIIEMGEKDSTPENLAEKLKELQAQIEVYRAKLEESDKKLQESSDKKEQLQKELEMAQLDSRQYLARIASLEEKVSLSHIHMNQMMENALDSLKLQLKESHKQSSSSEDLIQSLEAHVRQMEKQLTQQLTADLQPGVTSPPSEQSGDDTVCEGDSDTATENGHSGPSPSLLVPDSNILASVSSTTSSLSDFSDNGEDVNEVRQAQRTAEEAIQKYKEEVKESSLQLQRSTTELEQLKKQYFEAQQTAKEKADMVSDLQEQLRKAELATIEVKEQILTLRGELESERTKHRQTTVDLQDTRSQLQVAQQAAKQSHNEAEQLRNKIKVLQEEVETEKKERLSAQRHSHTDSTYAGRPNRSKAEFQALKEECSGLRKRIQAIEAEMKMSRKENLQLSSEYNKLQESYKQLEALKEKLASGEGAWRPNLTDAQKDAQKTKHEGKDSPRSSTSSSSSSSAAAGSTRLSTTASGRKLQAASKQSQVRGGVEEVNQLRSRCQDYSQQVTSLKAQIDSMESDFRQLSQRSKKLSFMSSIPLLMLLFAVLMAVYPTLEQITATAS